jgi:anthranilate phosphoribosyltransferase
VQQGNVKPFTITPEQLGLPVHPLEAVRGGSAEENAAALRRVLDGEPGPCRDFTLINAAAALVAAGLASGLREGVEDAARTIDSGAARERMEAYIKVSNEVAG